MTIKNHRRYVTAHQVSTFYVIAEYLHLLKMACSLALKDEGFQLPTPLAERALKCAERLLEWLSEPENKKAASVFASNFIGSLKVSFQPIVQHDPQESKCGNAITSCLHPKDL